jgi:hypothetical protein
MANGSKQDLRVLAQYEVTNLTHAENFRLVEGVDVFDFPQLKRISGLPLMQKIRIFRCTCWTDRLRTWSSHPAHSGKTLGAAALQDRQTSSRRQSRKLVATVLPSLGQSTCANPHRGSSLSNTLEDYPNRSST